MRGRVASLSITDVTNDPKYNPQAPAWKPSAATTSRASEGTTASSSLAGTPSRAATSGADSNSQGPLNGFQVYQNTTELDKRYHQAFGLVRPVTSKSEAHNLGLKPVTFPDPLEKEIFEKLWQEARKKDLWDNGDFKAAIEHIYELVKGYVVRYHDGVPHVVTDVNLVLDDPRTWAYMTKLSEIQSAYGSTHMAYLLSEPHYRPYIIQRMIVDYIFRKMLSPSLFLGYSDQMDGHLTAIHDKLVTMASREYHPIPI